MVCFPKPLTKQPLDLIDRAFRHAAVDPQYTKNQRCFTGCDWTSISCTSNRSGLAGCYIGAAFVKKCTVLHMVDQN